MQLWVVLWERAYPRGIRLSTRIAGNKDDRKLEEISDWTRLWRGKLPVRLCLCSRGFISGRVPSGVFCTTSSRLLCCHMSSLVGLWGSNATEKDSASVHLRGWKIGQSIWVSGWRKTLHGHRLTARLCFNFCFMIGQWEMYFRRETERSCGKKQNSSSYLGPRVTLGPVYYNR